MTAYVARPLIADDGSLRNPISGTVVDAMSILSISAPGTHAVPVPDWASGLYVMSLKGGGQGGGGGFLGASGGNGAAGANAVESLGGVYLNIVPGETITVTLGMGGQGGTGGASPTAGDVGEASSISASDSGWVLDAPGGSGAGAAGVTGGAASGGLDGEMSPIAGNGGQGGQGGTTPGDTFAGNGADGQNGIFIYGFVK